jgi:uncharacterized protein (TIGR03067 family)
MRNAPMVMALAILLAGSGLLIVASDARDEAIKRELKAMEGAWRPVSVEVDGQKAPEEALKESVVTRDAAGKVVGRRGAKVVLEGTVKKIDPTKKPKTIDTEVTEGENKGRTILGIYEVKDDTLRICVALPGKGERPTEFSAKAGSGCAFMIYKREKK